MRTGVPIGRGALVEEAIRPQLEVAFMTIGIRGAPTGGLRGLAMSPSSTAISKDAEGLVFLIRSSAAVQAERLQAIVDGAVLAVEQVQDKRIELLEKGPEVEISDVIFDMLLSVCLMGLGKALVPITESIAKNLVQVASFYGSLPSSRVGRVLAGAAAFFDTKFASRSVSIGPNDITKYNAYVREVVTRGVNKALEKGTEKGLGSVEKRKPLTNEVDLEATDTPGVAILGAAQTYASSQRAANAIHHAGLEAVVRAGADSTLLAQIRDVVSYDPLPDEIVAVRDQHKMLFEAVIWSKLFGFDQSIHLKAASFSSDIELPGVKPPLMRYWSNRFARTIERWLGAILAQSSNTPPVHIGDSIGVDIRPFLNSAGDAIQPGSFKKQDAQRQESTVVRFFVVVSRALASLGDQGIGEGGISVTLAPVAKS